jgi:hypothetical protein
VAAGARGWRVLLVRRPADYLALAGCALLSIAWYLPWYRLGEQVLRPADLPWGWVPVGGWALLASLLLVEPVAPWTRWLRPLVLLAGGLLLGLAVAALLAPALVGALLWQTFGAPLDALATELNSWTSVPLLGGRVAEWQAALRGLARRFAIAVLWGPWVFGAGALALSLGAYGAVVPPATRPHTPSGPLG